jgi:hypothetical protein
MATEQIPRKKRKQRDSKLLFIILGVIGGLLILAILITGAVLAAMNMGGGGNAPGNVVIPVGEKPPEKPKEQPPAKDIGEKKRDHTNIRLRVERTHRLNEMRQIALFYEDFKSINGGRPPATVEAFLKYLPRDAQQIKEAIEEKYYVIVPNVQTGIVAYEFDPDTRSMHGFVDQGTAVSEISTDELLKRLKEQGSR